MRETLASKYDEFKGVLDVLPVNTKSNQKKKLDFITEEEEATNELLKQIENEFNNRLAVLDILKENPNIAKLEAELEKCNIVNEWNNYNTAYEKMHLDYYLYQLHRYYKENLDGVNNCIKKIIESFAKVDIKIKKEDFDFNNYAAEYIDKILNNTNDEELKKYFDEIYWKNSDIIRIIEVNFKSIYLRYEKQINKYYEQRHHDYLRKHSDSELYDLRIKLSKEISNLQANDAYINFQKFINNTYSVNDFKEADISKSKKIYFNEYSYTYENLDELYSVLNEYSFLIKYRYLLNDMKDKLNKKDE